MTQISERCKFCQDIQTLRQVVSLVIIHGCLVTFLGVAESRYKLQTYTQLKASLGLGFTNLTEENLYLKPATPEIFVKYNLYKII